MKEIAPEQAPSVFPPSVVPTKLSAASLSAWLAVRLSRVTSSGELIPEVDGLRFLAIGVVIFHHLMSIYLPASGRTGRIETPTEWLAAWQDSWLVRLAYSGHHGVPLFFVISGFILALPFARRYLCAAPAPGLPSYYLRRLTRLEPPYVINLFLSFLYLYVYNGIGPQHLPHLAASLFYVHGFVYGQPSWINHVAWSLEIEIQFYLLAPLLAGVFALRHTIARRAVLLTLIAGWSLIADYVIGASGSARWMLSLPYFLSYFFVGFLLADLYLTERQRAVRKYLRWDIVTLAAAAAIPAILTRYYLFHALLPFVVLLLYLGCYLGRLSNAFVRLRWLVIIGGMCYTLYLYHALIIAAAMPYTIRFAAPDSLLWVDFLRQCLVLVPLVPAVVAVLFVLTEKPFMRWRMKPRPAAARIEAEISLVQSSCADS